MKGMLLAIADYYTVEVVEAVSCNQRQVHELNVCLLLEDCLSIVSLLGYIQFQMSGKCQKIYQY